jgi:hypothetical protein
MKRAFAGALPRAAYLPNPRARLKPLNAHYGSKKLGARPGLHHYDINDDVTPSAFEV